MGNEWKTDQGGNMDNQNQKKRNPFAVIFRHVGSRVWFIVTAVVAVLLIVVTPLALSRQVLGGVFDRLFGGERAIAKSGSTVTTAFELDDDVKAGDKTSAQEHGNKVNNELCEEGMVLLKNKNNALPAKTDSTKKISVFGRNSINMAIAGSGSAGNSTDSKTKDIYDSLADAGYEINPTLKEFYKKDKTERSSNPGMDDGGSATLNVGETPVSNYTDAVKGTFNSYSDMAIIFLTRIGGEGFDLPRAQPGDSSKTFLDLDKDEEAMIDMVTKAGFKKVVVLVNAANQLNCTALEQNDKIDGILWIGFPGAQGTMAVGKILNGSVNPSGHLTDTYVKDFKSIPSYYNFGDNSQCEGVGDNGDAFLINASGKLRSSLYYFTNYEEGVYIGYRYYETRGENNENWYTQNVLYPFGYGLSYSTFDWTITNESSLNGKELTKDPFDVKVKVTNTSKVAGKDVVQIYMGGTYYAGGIEKSSKVLVGFAKTGLLEPGKSEELTISVDPYYLANYDYNDANKNGFKGYELDKGAYSLYVASTAHDSSRKISMNSENGLKFENDNVTGTKVENHFDGSDSNCQTTLSRNDWEGTFPAASTQEERTIDTKFRDQLKSNNTSLDDANPYVNGTKTAEMPTYGADNGMKLIDLQGKDFDDPLWEKLLDQTTFDEQLSMYIDAGFHTEKMTSITKPSTIDADGPVGLTAFMGDPTVNNTVMYCCEVITASTWNVDLLEKLGESVGNEGLVGNNGVPYTGWYAPAMNLHRNPFGGRCCEYFSEDPFLSGMMGAYEVKGANKKGMTTYLKHFVGNEGETHRDANGDCTFVNEQALRELYLRPFEITVKVGKSRGIMTSFNRIGTRWSGATYSLTTTILREEWGFHGAVITDFNTHHNKGDYMQIKPALYAGGTLDLCSQTADSSLIDSSNATDCLMLRNATHETLYAVVNSNILGVEIDHYAMAYWQIVLMIIDIAVPVGLVVWGFFAIRKAYKDEKAEVAEEK